MPHQSETRSISRRRALQLTGGLASAWILGCGATKPADEVPEIQYANHEILMLVYPRFTSLDLIGPQHVFALLGPEYKTRLVWKDRTEIVSDTGVPIRPTMTFSECRAKPTILFIPGGTDGTLAAMEDKQVRDFVADMGSQATYVTSVCTGSLVLGAAGLIRGYKATTHWLAMSVLEKFGAEATNQRVVVDRNRVTGAGVTAGIDFGLTLSALLKGDDYAQTMQLMMEYDPRPPFASGNPQVASAEAVELLTAMADPFLVDIDATLERIAAQ
ncbi:MAG: DJ-1/PfpI family protein [Planctomycetaceae bacterium]|nr:DJ-1/PfpI family protein [Planctomycetaceae bacterium]